MNAEAAKAHPSRLAEDAVTPVDFPVSGRSQPRPVPVTAPCDVWFTPTIDLTTGLPYLRVTCGPHDWSMSLPDPHTLRDLTRLVVMHGGPGQPGENKGEPDGLVGPGPVTDFSSPSSPPAEGVTVDVACTAVAGDLRCVLPPGHYAHHRAAFRGHSITWPADEAPFGSESEPGGAS